MRQFTVAAECDPNGIALECVYRAVIQDSYDGCRQALTSMELYRMGLWGKEHFGKPVRFAGNKRVLVLRYHAACADYDNARFAGGRDNFYSYMNR
jgi:hypothetical protein